MKSDVGVVGVFDHVRSCRDVDSERHFDIDVASLVVNEALQHPCLSLAADLSRSSDFEWERDEIDGCDKGHHVQWGSGAVCTAPSREWDPASQRGDEDGVG